MANTYSELYVHVIFAVKGRENLISEKRREELQKYINGIIRNEKQKLLAIYCMPDHTHLLMSLTPEIKMSYLVRDIKANSSQFINEKKWLAGKFQWQEGYGLFSCGPSALDTLIEYILKQPQHHEKTTFKAEYSSILKSNDVDYQEEYLFKFPE